MAASKQGLTATNLDQAGVREHGWGMATAGTITCLQCRLLYLPRMVMVHASMRWSRRSLQ